MNNPLQTLLKTPRCRPRWQAQRLDSGGFTGFGGFSLNLRSFEEGVEKTQISEGGMIPLKTPETPLLRLTLGRSPRPPAPPAKKDPETFSFRVSSRKLLFQHWLASLTPQVNGASNGIAFSFDPFSPPRGRPRAVLTGSAFQFDACRSGGAVYGSRILRPVTDPPGGLVRLLDEIRTAS